MKVYLATWLVEVSQGKSLTKVGKRERLLSYYHIKDEQFQCHIVFQTIKKEKEEEA